MSLVSSLSPLSSNRTRAALVLALVLVLGPTGCASDGFVDESGEAGQLEVTSRPNVVADGAGNAPDFCVISNQTDDESEVTIETSAPWLRLPAKVRLGAGESTSLEASVDLGSAKQGQVAVVAGFCPTIAVTSSLVCRTPMMFSGVPS